MKITERYEIHRRTYPFAERLNPILHDIIVEKAKTLDKGALMTSWHCHDIKEFVVIAQWVKDFLWSVDAENIYTPVLQGDLWSGNTEMELYNIWGQLYNKGDYQTSHVHLPHHWSFVYYVNTPPGSSPLVFTHSNRKIYPKSGEVLIFPAWIRHEVPPNKCEGRTVVAGNYRFVKIDDAS